MTRFITHVTTPVEVARLSYIRRAVERHFPEARLQVINQTGHPVKDSVAMENIKHCGLGWTLRFLQLFDLQPDDLLIKIDPDIDIRGNPLEGIEIPQGACFGQIKLVHQVPVFLGGFQGYTGGAAKAIAAAGKLRENDTGPQDIILYELGVNLGTEFICLPWCDIWAEPSNFDPNCKILAWRSR